MARGSTGILSTFLQRGAGPTILQSPSPPSGGHPFLSQPRAALDGGDLHGAIPRGTLVLHKAMCGWEPPLISHVGLSGAWSQAISVMGKQLQAGSELPWTPSNLRLICWSPTNIFSCFLSLSPYCIL